MNILINCSNLKVGGGLQVAHSFLSELYKYPQHNYIVVYSLQLGKLIDFTSIDSRITHIPHSIKFPYIDSNFFLDRIVDKYKIEKVFTIFGPAYWKPKVSHICGYAKPHYLYKESPFFTQLSLLHKIKFKIKELIHIHSFKQSDILITENEDITQRLHTLVSDKKIFTVSNYYNQVFDNEQLWDKTIELPSYGGITLLTISANYPHKNLKIIPQTVEVLLKKYPQVKFRFILTVNESDLTITDSKIKRHIIFLGKIRINQCPYLYTQSDFMFLPTLLECFSASYAEAMYMKIPVLTSNLNFAKGLCGKAAVYFDPLSPQDIAEKIFTLSKDKNLRKILVKEGLTQLENFDNYETRARKYLDIIETCRLI
jgi:glycosyltransferase involved in cell wall biosynthesis